MRKSIKFFTVFAVICVFLATAFFAVKTGKLPFVEKITKPNTVRVTVPEGYSLTQIAKKLEESGVCSAESFVAAANNTDLYSSYSLLADVKNTEKRIFVAEGYIFPDTYDFYIGEASEKALSRFMNNTEKQITDEIKSRADKLGYTVDEIITMASIIQKEAGISSEMGKVSSVIHNRLGDSYNRLGCDVTVNYLKKYISPYVENAVELYSEHYNTYKCFGLPAGPICNPGLSAIKAALYPEKTDYKFFCTDKEMNFYYAETYEGHLENCKKAGLK